MHILIVENHPLVSRALKNLILDAHPSAQVLEVSTANDGLHHGRSEALDLVVLDLSLPDRHGIELLAELKTIRPDLAVIVVTMHAETEFARQAFKLGANGYVTKDKSPLELREAITQVLAGGRYLSSDFAAQIAQGVIDPGQGALHEKLTSREFRIMQQLAVGRSLVEIANNLHISPKTVTTYRTRILHKMGLAANTDLARYCVRHKLLDSGLANQTVGVYATEGS